MAWWRNSWSIEVFLANTSTRQYAAGFRFEFSLFAIRICFEFRASARPGATYLVQIAGLGTWSFYNVNKNLIPNGLGQGFRIFGDKLYIALFTYEFEKCCCLIVPADMLSYLIKRLFSTIPVLIGISLLLFFMLRLLPGDPAQVLAGQMATPAEIENIRQQLGLDRPIYEQYANYLSRLVRFDLGRSARTQNPVTQEIWARLPNTLLLAVVAILLACLFGIPAGIISAVKPYSWIDYLVTTSALFGMSMPVFWLGLMLVVLFSVILKWLPAGGTGSWQHVILPSITLAAFVVAFIARMTRSTMLETLSQDFTTTARSKGLQERVVVIKHAFKNAMIPIITVVGLQFGLLLGGAVLTETVFAWPGLGRLIVDSILARDYPVIQGTILIFGLLYIMVNLAVDLIYALVDPRIRYD